MNPESDLSSQPDDESAFVAAFLRELLEGGSEHRDAVLAKYLDRYPSRSVALKKACEDAGATPGAQDLAAEERRVLGHYRLLQLLGRGGQGEVYLAEDTRLGRKVAVKILRALGAASPAALARFRREVEIASHLDHPAICAVFDTGIDRGVPFYVMRYVEGEPLSRRITTARERTSGEPSSTALLTPSPEATEPALVLRAPKSGPDAGRGVRSVLIMMEEAARALHAAHEAGIIHRDIKPGNIMVTPEVAPRPESRSGKQERWADEDETGRLIRRGEKPVILDFGLAQEMEGEGASQTLTGDLFGTPAYMSPEQLQTQRTRLDRRTDVWSLGVTLYECLALRRPFDAPTRQGLYQAIQTRDPPDPRPLNAAISSDLKAVIGLALEKDRDRRYQTAELFADDIARVLKGVPTLARPVGPVGMLRRWTRREPVKAALVLLVLVTFPAIATLVTIYVKDRPNIELVRQVRLQDDKDAILSTAFNELSEGSTEAALRMFEKVLDMEGGSPEAAAGTVLAHLRRGEAGAAEQTLNRHAHLLKGRAAFVLLRADVLRALRRKPEADQVLRTAPEPEDSLDHHLLAERAMQAGERERDVHRDGREHFLRALRHATRAVLLSPGFRAVLLELRAHAAGHCQDRETAIESAEVLRARWPNVASAHYWAGLALGSFDDPALRDDAIAAYREAIRLDPGHVAAHTNLGMALNGKGDRDGAIKALREAIRLRPDSAASHFNLGVALIETGHSDDAIAAWRETVRLKPGLALAHFNLGNALVAKGRLDDAIAAYRKAIRLNPDYALAHSNLGLALNAKGLLDDAIAAWREAIRLKPDNALAHYNLGIALKSKGSIDEAIASYREAIRLDPLDADPHCNLGLALMAKGLPDDAIAAYREAIRLKSHGTAAYYNLGNALMDKGLLDEAIAAYREAIQARADDAEAHCNLGLSLQAAGRLPEALAALRKGHTLGSQRADWPIPSADWVANAERLLQKNAAEEAKLEAHLAAGTEPESPSELARLARAALRTGRARVAARWYQSAFERQPELADDLSERHRYHAACAASKASAEALGGEVDTALRQQALARLTEDLDAWEARFESGRIKDSDLRRTLSIWQHEAALAAVRGDALASLPESEQAAFAALWERLARILAGL